MAIHPFVNAFGYGPSILQGISCVPVLGILPSWITQKASVYEMHALYPSEILPAVYVKTEFMVADVVRNVLTAALVIAGFASGILGAHRLVATVVCTGIGIACAGMAILNVGRIHHNLGLMQDLRPTNPHLFIR